MTTDTTPLAPCPFCGAPAHGYAIEPHLHSPSLMRLIPELPDHPGSYVIEGQCACGSGLIGEDETEVVALWNRRAPQPSPTAQGDVLDATRWRWLSEHIQGAWNEGKFTSLVRIVSEQHRQSLNASVDRMMAGDWSGAARAAQGGKKP